MPLFIGSIIRYNRGPVPYKQKVTIAMERKHIYIAYTGGTIGMQKSHDHGYVPVAGFMDKQLASMPEFHRPEMPEYTIHEYSPLMDSSDMTPLDWQTIADDIRANYDKYDGFVILHGTDTMAYTASALSFMLENLGKASDCDRFTDPSGRSCAQMVKQTY